MIRPLTSSTAAFYGRSTRKGLSYSLALLCFTLLFSAKIYAQENRKTTAKTFLIQNAAKFGLSAEQAAEMQVSDAYESKGLKHYYFQQSYQGLPVYNALMNVVVLPNGESKMTGNRFVKSLPNAKSADIPSLSPEQAIEKVATHLNLRYLKKASLIEIDKTAIPKGAFLSKYFFDKGDISTENIAVELMWVNDTENQVHLAWNVLVYETSLKDIWNVRVDAISGQVIEKNSYVAHCDFSEQSSVISEELGSCEVDKSENILSNLSTGDYNIFDMPIEAPSFGSRTIVNNPWTRAGAGNNAASLQWHNDGATTYTITRGNNVWAKEDIANDNETTIGASASSVTSDFNFSYNGAATNPVTNQNAAITNLFFTNNIIHDVLYQYGFDEASGNFQNNNQGRGGLGNDYVFADAFDGSGTNNANFGTPPDGQNPRMQMFVWTTPTPDVTSDFDNGVITHEYGHGISNRLTGGPANTSCLSNAEQMGEGWSDFFALMLVTNWATAQANDTRGIGTYVLGQSTSGVGIRQYPYSYNIVASPYDYNYARANPTVHKLGSAWCAMLWDMTWNIIAMTPASTDIYHGSGGNNIALQLVTEALKLQPCSPGFVDGRDAILLADEILYNGAHRCAIWSAFARRGLGYSASQGSSNSMTDGSQATDLPAGLTMSLTSDEPTLFTGETATYTAKIRCGCTAAQNNIIPTIALPTGLTHQSGGTFSGGNVTFPSTNFAIGQIQSFSFDASLNNTAPVPLVLLSDEVETTPQFTATGTAPVFAVSANAPLYGNNSWFVDNPGSVSNRFLTLNTALAIPSTGSYYLYFTHEYNTEASWDGGVVEYSTNNGTNWTDAQALFTQNGYNGSLNTGSQNPLVGRPAFTSSSNGKKVSIINLSSFANQNLLFRFRFGSDESVGALGWKIDRIWVGTAATCLTLTANAMQANVSLANATICQNVSHIPATLGINCPSALSTCNPVTYPTITPINGEGGNTITYNIPASNTFPTGTTNVIVTVTDAVGHTANCNFDVVIGGAAPTITSSPAAVNGVVSLCTGASATLTGSTADEYLWYKNGVAVNYALTPNYIVSTNSVTGDIYTLAVANTGLACESPQSAPITLVNVSPTASITPSGPTTFCANSSVTLNANTGTGYNYVWKRGTTVVGSNSSAYIPTASGNHNVTITSSNNCSKTSAWTSVTINPLPSANAGLDKSICTNASATLGTTANAAYSYNWSPTTNLTGANTANPIVTPTAANTTSYTLTVTNTSTNCVNTDMVNVVGLEIPNAPTLNISTSPVCQGSSITMTPSNALSASSVQWYKNNVALYNQAPAFVTTLTAVTASPVAYYIKSKNAAGCFSSSSNTVNAMINPAPIPTISSTPAAVGSTINVCVPGGSNGTATLTANIPAGSPTVSYVWQQLVSNVYNNIATGNAYTANVSTTANNKTFRVQATYSNTCVKTSSARIVKLVTSGCVPKMGDNKGGGLSEIIVTSELLTAYPNPTEGLLNVSIENSDATAGKLVLYNALGQIVAERNIFISNGKGSEILDLREIAIGIYTLSFQTESTHKVQKIVKE